MCLAANIVERSIYMLSHEPLQVVLNFHHKEDRVQLMVRKSLDTLTRMDAKIVQIILTLNGKIYDLNR